MNLISLYKVCEDKEELPKKLQEWGLIPREGLFCCSKCGDTLSLVYEADRSDGYRWHCNNNKVVVRKQKAQKCGVRVEFRTKTFFAGSKLSIFQILGFVNLWVSNVQSIVIAQQLSISQKAAVDWSSFCREVLLDAFILKGEKLGGEDKTVEIDESKFGKRKYHRGHHVEGQWVFGGYERGSGRIFMVAVADRKAETLLPIIENWIEKGTTIVSDYWKAYDCLDLNGFKHLKVNHSLHFKDPETGAHTNSIESSWRHAKAVQGYGRKQAHIPGNLARYMFYKKCKELNLERTLEFFRLAGQIYNPMNHVEALDPEHEEVSDAEDNLFLNFDP